MKQPFFSSSNTGMTDAFEDTLSRELTPNKKSFRRIVFPQNLPQLLIILSRSNFFFLPILIFFFFRPFKESLGKPCKTYCNFSQISNRIITLVEDNAEAYYTRRGTFSFFEGGGGGREKGKDNYSPNNNSPDDILDLSIGLASATSQRSNRRSNRQNWF